MRGILPIVAVSSVVILSGCCNCTKVVIRDPSVAVLAEGTGRECPHSPEHGVPLSGAITKIPEYHDCQRFIVKDDDGKEVYDSLYAIFASFRLDTLTHDIDSANSSAQSTVAVPGATVVSYGGTYSVLHIADGFNCLYLWRRGLTWRAWMVNNPPTVEDCPSKLVIDPENPPYELKVVARKAPGFAQDQDYPPVARWEWDAAEGEQYIGIKCGAAWCEVSDDTVTAAVPDLSSVDFAMSGGGSSSDQEKAKQRVRIVKGWHDAQRLGMLAADGRTVPSGVWGAVVPHPRLAQMKQNEAFSDDWVHVATIWASGEYNGLVLRLRQGADNRIFLCYGSMKTCPDIPSDQTFCESNPDAKRWWGKTEHGPESNKSVEYRCIYSVPHTPPPNVPATARWRWLAHDETTWTRCDDGCCKLL